MLTQLLACSSSTASSVVGLPAFSSTGGPFAVVTSTGPSTWNRMSTTLNRRHEAFMTRVMVVEDDENLLVGVAAPLQAAGLAVDTATSIAAAHDALGAGGPDCVVFDRMLPDGDAIGYVHSRRREGWGVAGLVPHVR